MIMGGMALFSMAASVTNSGIDAGKNADSLKEKIKNVNATTKSLENRWNSVIQNNEKFDLELKGQMRQDLDQLKQLSDQCINNKQLFDKNYRNIQIAGVLFVVFIFFILILKEVGIIDDIQNGLSAKFKKN